MKEGPKGWVVRATAWEDSDFVVSIRPIDEKPWRDLPIGGVLDKATAKRVAEWLRGALSDLLKVGANIRDDELKGETQ